MGGTIGVRSSLGAGSTFFVVLTMEVVDAARAQQGLLQIEPQPLETTLIIAAPAAAQHLVPSSLSSSRSH